MHVRQQTDPEVLPQLPALESMSADNPGVGTKRGVDATNLAAPGVQHGRGETGTAVPASPAKGTRPTPGGGSDPATTNTRTCAGGTARESRRAEQRVFVLDRRGKPLMPTTPRRARGLLRSGRARVHRVSPFVIRLIDRTVEESGVQPLVVGIDPGSRHTGIALAAETEQADTDTGEIATVRAGVFLLRIDHRGPRIRDRLYARAALRRARRSRNLRYRAPRFNNRTRPKGWLPPSLEHRVVTIRSWVNRLCRWAPVGCIDYEAVRFDTQALQSPGIAGAEYQRGPLWGTEVREYVLARDRHICAYCGASGTGPGSVPLNLDHVVPRARGGSNRPSNLVAACIPCNQAKGARKLEEFLAHSPARLARVRRHLRAPLADAAAVTTTRWALHRSLTATGIPVRAFSGGRTKWNRTRADLAKDHVLDALCVGYVDRVTAVPDHQHVASATGRGTYARTLPDRYGFPRLVRTRQKVHHGFATGDLVRATVPRGKHAGTHTGRIAMRATGSCNITTRAGVAQGIHHRYIRLLQRADGYRHTAERVPA